MYLPVNNSYFVNRPALLATNLASVHFWYKVSSHKLLAISLGLLLLLATVIQTLHDHSHHDTFGSVVGCEYCTATPSYDAALSSHSFKLSFQFIDSAIVVFVVSFVVANPNFSQQSRAPPSTFLS